MPVRRVRRPSAPASASTSASRARRAVDLEHLRAGVLGDELRRRPGGDRLAVGHDQHRVGEALRLLDVVRRHQDRRAFAAERVDQRPELLAHLRIEPDGRLVEEHEPGPVDERARDQQPPPHPAGELVDAGVAPVDELRQLERALDRIAPLGAADPVEVREDEQVLLDRERDVEVVELRRDAELRPRLLRLVRELEAEQLELALVGDRLRGQEPHRRRLAGAVRPEQADAGALGHVEIEAVDGRDLAVALDDAAEADRQFGQASSSTERMLPAGSVNHAIVGPSSMRAIPFSSWSKPS